MKEAQRACTFVITCVCVEKNNARDLIIFKGTCLRRLSDLDRLGSVSDSKPEKNCAFHVHMQCHVCMYVCMYTKCNSSFQRKGQPLKVGR